MRSFIRNAAILGGLLLATTSFAQVKATPDRSMSLKSADNTVKEERGRVIFSAEEMTSRLGLKADQAEKLKSIEADCNKRMMALEKLDPKERNAKEAKVNAERIKMVQSVLTSEQQKKLNMMEDEVIKVRQEKKIEPAQNISK